MYKLREDSQGRRSGVLVEPGSALQINFGVRQNRSKFGIGACYASSDVRFWG